MEALNKLNTGATALTSTIKSVAGIFKTERSSSITSIEKLPGFSEIKLSWFSANSTKMKNDYLQKTYINKILDENAPQEIKDELFSELEAVFNSELGDFHIFHLAFKNGKGQFVSIALFMNRSNETTTDLAWSRMFVQFTLAPTRVIKRKKKSSIFSSSEWDEVTYEPSNITKEELDGYFCLHAQNMAAIR